MKKKILIIGGILLVDYLIAQCNKPRIFVRKKLPNNYNAMTIPPFGIFISENEKDNEKLIAHEKIHWEQYKKTGAILFSLKYLYQKMRYGYDKMPMEIEARKKLNESDFCQENYTQCVRNGQSVTVQNTLFRQ